MVAIVGLVAVPRRVGLGLPLGAAILLGAAVAPTNSAMALDVQIAELWDRDRLRFALTGETGSAVANSGYVRVSIWPPRNAGIQ
jgi:NhaP-type Na+/H+ or K+/H+ antiporter